MYQDDFNGFNDFQQQDSLPPSQTRPGAYGWHWPLTLLSLVLVSGLSFLMAYLTKDVNERSVGLMGLIFMVPAGAMFLAAMIMEFGLGAMTPQISRSVQIRTAVFATAATFGVACLCDAVYLHGGFVADSADNMVFLVYEDSTAGNSPTDRAVMEVLDELYRRAGDKVQVGLFMFSFGNSGTRDARDSVVPLANFSVDQRQKIYNSLIHGQKYQASAYGHEEAYSMVEQSGTDRNTKVIIISDKAITYGNSSYTQVEWDRDLQRLAKANIALSFMGNGAPDEGMYYVAEKSGGMVVTGYTSENVLGNLKAITRTESDMVRADTASATVLTGVMLLLEGLVIGLGLMLLLSVSGQKRIQVILSPLLAVAAFLVLKVLPIGDNVPQWVVEGAAFSLLGIVFMNRNSGFGAKRGAAPVQQSDFGNQGGDSFTFDF